MSHGEHREHADRQVIQKTLPAVVQVVALQRGFLGNLSTAWTGSGTIVDRSGIILTNCHVANPRAMGMSAPQADLAISITENSDEPPVLTYAAQIMTQSPDMAYTSTKTSRSGAAEKWVVGSWQPVAASPRLFLSPPY